MKQHKLRQSQFSRRNCIHRPGREAMHRAIRKFGAANLPAWAIPRMMTPRPID